MILSGSSVLAGMLLTAFIVFGLMSVMYILFNESLKDNKLKDKQSEGREPIEPKNTINLLEEKPFEPAASVTENSTELLFIENKTKKLG